MRHHTQTGFRAWAKASAASLFLGPNHWTIEGDSVQCSTNGTYSSWVAVTGCNDTEFSCRSHHTKHPHDCLNCCTGREAAYPCLAVVMTAWSVGTKATRSIAVSSSSQRATKGLLFQEEAAKLQLNMSIEIINILNIDEVGHMHMWNPTIGFYPI